MDNPQHSNQISRRAVARGVVWTAPVVAVAAAAPAYAASSVCTDASKKAIDAAFGRPPYLCNGVKPRMEINFHQPTSASNGGTVSSYVNVKNLSGCALTFTKENPLRLKVQVVANVNANTTRELVGIGSSFGSSIITEAATGGVVGPTQASPAFTRKNRAVLYQDTMYTIDWSYFGTVNSGAERDIHIHWGLSAPESYVLVTPLASSGAPTLESVGLTTEQQPLCVGYYNTKLANYEADAATNSPIDWVYKKWSGNWESSYTHVSVAPGVAVNSKDARNSNPGSILDYDHDGVW